MKNLLFPAAFLLCVLSSGAQSWTLKDTGVGLIVKTEDNDKPLKIMKRGSTWDARELYENGAMEGKYRGNQLFAAWIQGPEINNPDKNENKEKVDYKLQHDQKEVRITETEKSIRHIFHNITLNN